MPNTINLKGECIQKEGAAEGAITPGMQVEFSGTNGPKPAVQAAGAAGSLSKAFALEMDLIGRGIDDAYQEGEVVRYGVFPPGCEVYAFLGSGESVVIGAPLSGAGDGSLAAAGSGAAAAAYALEEVDNSTGSGMARIIVEVA